MKHRSKDTEIGMSPDVMKDSEDTRRGRATAGREAPSTDGAVILEFGRSSSANYPIAVEVAQRHPTYRETGSAGELRHSVTFDFGSFNDIRELFELVGRWKTTTLTVNGRTMPAGTAFAVLSCYSERCRAFRPEEYCFNRSDPSDYNDNDLGCRHCGINPYDWHGLKGFGTMTAGGVFIVDKDRIAHEVTKNLEDYLWCPALQLEKIEQRLREIPDRIDPRKHHEWEYITQWEDSKEVAVAVRKKQRRSGQQYVLRDYGGQGGEAQHEPSRERPSSPPKRARGCGCLMAVLALLVLLLLLTRSR